MFHNRFSGHCVLQPCYEAYAYEPFWESHSQEFFKAKQIKTDYSVSLQNLGKLPNNQKLFTCLNLFSYNLLSKKASYQRAELTSIESSGIITKKLKESRPKF